MTIFQVHFHLAFPQGKDPVLSHALLIAQAVLRFVNIFFFFVNTFNGKPGGLCEKP
jgi:hypothetical protein